MTTPIVTLQNVLDRLDILTSAVLSNKQTLNIDEAAAFTGLAKRKEYNEIIDLLTKAGAKE